MHASHPALYNFKNQSNKTKQTCKDSHGFNVISADLSSQVVILVRQLVGSFSTAANGDVHKKAISVFSPADSLDKSSQMEVE